MEYNLNTDKEVQEANSQALQDLLDKLKRGACVIDKMCYEELHLCTNGCIYAQEQIKRLTTK